VVLLGIYAVIQVAAFFYWSTNTAADGFFQLSLDRLDLHKFQRAAASKPDKFITLRHKMQIARVLADSKGWSRAEIYDKVLGSRFYDATEERGFWMGYFKPAQSGRASEEPVVLWNQIDPLEKWAKELEVRVENVGPYRLGRLNPENYPQEWEWDDGTKLRMPVRTIPELREYGFVPGHSWPPGVVRLRTQLELKRQPRSYLLVVITKGEKLVPRLWINGVIARAIEKNETLMTAESFYVLSQDLSSGVNQLRLELDHQSGFDLEVFGWAKW
jgi:hypothetical protein